MLHYQAHWRLAAPKDILVAARHLPVSRPRLSGPLGLVLYKPRGLLRLSSNVCRGFCRGWPSPPLRRLHSPAVSGALQQAAAAEAVPVLGCAHCAARHSVGRPCIRSGTRWSAGTRTIQPACRWTCSGERPGFAPGCGAAAARGTCGLHPLAVRYPSFASETRWTTQLSWNQ